MIEWPQLFGWGARIGALVGVAWSVADNWGLWTHGVHAGALGDMVARAFLGGIVGLFIGWFFVWLK
jgi:hypothetical protein